MPGIQLPEDLAQPNHELAEVGVVVWGSMVAQVLHGVAVAALCKLCHYTGDHSGVGTGRHDPQPEMIGGN
jgi:hypothetical protein